MESTWPCSHPHPLVERVDDRRSDDVEAVLEVHGGDRGLEECGEDVAAQGDPGELGPRDVLRPGDENEAEIERARDRRAALS